MAQYNLNRINPNIATPQRTRMRHLSYVRRRSQSSSSDSSLDNERWRNNYPLVSALIHAAADSDNDSEDSLRSDQSLAQTQSRSSSSSESLEQNNIHRLNGLQQQSPSQNSSQVSTPSSHNTIDINRRLNADVSITSEDSNDERIENQLHQLLLEQEDEYVSEDDIGQYNILNRGLIDQNNAPQNKLEEFLNSDEANEVHNGRVNVTKPEIFLAVIKYALVHNLSQTAIADLFKMLNLFFSSTDLPQSRYLVDEMFNFTDNIDYYAMCPNCKGFVSQFNRENDNVVHCDACDLDISLNDPTYRDFFCIINPESEIADLLKENWSHYESVVEARAENQEDINEFYNGLAYQRLRNSLPNNKKDNFVTLTFNSDGSPVFESSAFSVWPIQVMVNELPFKLRTSKLIVCGLWFGRNKPDMNIFLGPFVTLMNNLAENGITFNLIDIPHTIYIYAICSCDDSVARAPMQGLTQFNGYYGCNWCLHPGYYVATGRGGCVKYIVMDEPIPDRNHEDSLVHMREAFESGRSVYGFINGSILIELRFYDIISGFVVDKLHCCDEGVGKQFQKYWMDTSNMPYSLTNAEIELIDNALKTFKVPSKLMRNCRSLRDRKYWKAKEFQNWILYYSIPALLLIPRMRYYAIHWSYFVRGYYILLQNNISRDQIREAHRLLTVFVALTETYYSRSAMTFNVHQLLHLSQSVINWGPLHYHSGYGFEDGNGQIVREVHAAKGVIHQVCRNIGIKRSESILRKHMLRNDPYSDIIDFVRYLETKECIKVFKTDNGRYFGPISRPHPRWVAQLNLSQSAVVYKKLVRLECTYLSSETTRLRSNNSFAQTGDHTFIEIDYFIVDTETRQEYTICKNVDVINVADENHHYDDLQIKSIANINPVSRAINTNTIDRICVHLKTNDEAYLCPVPNLESY